MAIPQSHPRLPRPSLVLLTTIVVCVMEGIALLAAAHFDGVLRIEGKATGLLQHPGMLSILLGDVILSTLTAQALIMCSRIGERLPTKSRHATKRYFNAVVWKQLFGEPHLAGKFFLACATVGFLALANHTYKMFDATKYYGHDTFDSIEHASSFIANTLNLFISWCVVIPAFLSSIFVFIYCQSIPLKSHHKKGKLVFRWSHPDGSGGFAFFGNANALYLAGLLVVLMEVALLMYTHKKADLSNIAPLLIVAAGVVALSYFTILPLNRTIKRLEMSAKASIYLREIQQHAPSMRDFIIIYKANYDPYSRIVRIFMFIGRLAAFVPALYRLVPMLSG